MEIQEKILENYEYLSPKCMQEIFLAKIRNEFHDLLMQNDDRTSILSFLPVPENFSALWFITFLLATRTHLLYSLEIQFIVQDFTLSID